MLDNNHLQLSRQLHSSKGHEQTRQAWSVIEEQTKSNSVKGEEEGR